MWTTIRHLVWHDARALRMPLLVWAGILALQIAAVAVGPVLVGPIAKETDINAGQGAIVMRLAMTVILTALILQRDTAVGTTAFWLTRPISRVAMWASKLASITGWCLLLPSVLAWGLFVVLGLSAGSAWQAASQLLFEQVLLVAYAIIAASVTATLAHFVVTGLAGFAAAYVLTLTARAWRDALPYITLPWPNAILQAWSLAVVGGALAVSAHQYLTRRRARTWLLAGMCLVIAQSTLIFVRNAPSFDPAVWSSRPYTPPAGIEVRLGDNVADEPITMRGSTGQLAPGRALSANVYAVSSSDTDALEPVAVRSSVATTKAPCATTTLWSESQRRGIWWVSRPAGLDDQPYRSMRSALGVDTLSLPDSASVPVFQAYLAEWPVEAYRVFAEKGGGILRAEVVVKAYRYRVGGTMPLRAGASYTRSDQRLTITSIERTPRGIAVTVRTTFVSPFDVNVSQQGAVRYVLRNQARREALFSTDQQTSNTFLTLGTTRFGPGTGLRRFEFDSQRPSTGKIALTNEWRDAAELVVLMPVDLGTFIRSAEVPVLTTGAAK